MAEKLEPILEAIWSPPARLLRPLCVPLAGARSARHCARVLLLLDVGTLEVAPAEEAGELAVRLLPGAADAPREAEPLDEEEPWWAVMGNPIHGAWAVSDEATEGRAIELQFRPDQPNPRRIRISLDGDAVRIATRPRSGG